MDIKTLFAGLGPAAEADADGPAGQDILALVEQLAARHDLTFAEAAEVIADWEAGLIPQAAGP